MNSEIKSLLGNSLTVGSSSVPVAHLRYRGSEKTFITWSIIGDNPEFDADDELIYSVSEVDIDIYSNKNYTDIKDTIFQLFTDNGWVYVETSPEMYEEQEKLYHITLTFAKEKHYG